MTRLYLKLHEVKERSGNRELSGLHTLNYATKFSEVNVWGYYGVTVKVETLI